MSSIEAGKYGAGEGRVVPLLGEVRQVDWGVYVEGSSSGDVGLNGHAGFGVLGAMDLVAARAEGEVGAGEWADEHEVGAHLMPVGGEDYGVGGIGQGHHGADVLGVEEGQVRVGDQQGLGPRGGGPNAALLEDVIEAGARLGQRDGAGWQGKGIGFGANDGD